MHAISAFKFREFNKQEFISHYRKNEPEFQQHSKQNFHKQRHWIISDIFVEIEGLDVYSTDVGSVLRFGMEGLLFMLQFWQES